MLYNIPRRGLRGYITCYLTEKSYITCYIICYVTSQEGVKWLYNISDLTTYYITCYIT